MQGRFIVTCIFFLFSFRALSQAEDCSSSAPELVVHNDCRPLATGTSRVAGESLSNACSSFDDDVWFRFEAISSITSILIFTDQDSDVGVGFFQDCRTEIECADNRAVGGMERLDVETLIGTQYFVQVYDVLDGPGEFLICLTSGDDSEQSDCGGAEVICESGAVTFTPTGRGEDDFAGDANQEGCLHEKEHHSAWYYFEIQPTAPLNQLLTFFLDPTESSDYDFALFGPNVSCDQLGPPVRCSWADSFCTHCPLTGLGMGATDASEGPDGDGFLAPLLVQPGEGYFLLIDNYSADAAGFNIHWGGSAAPFLNCNALPPCGLFADAGPPVYICEENELQIEATVRGQTGFATYEWTTSGADVTIDNASSLKPSIFLPADFSGEQAFFLTISGTGCSHTDVLTVIRDCPVSGMDTCIPPLQVSFSSQRAGCLNPATGKLAIGSVTGGTPPYEYSIDEGVYRGAGFFGDLLAGSYLLRIRDGRGCSLDTLVEIGTSAEPSIEIGPDLQLNQGDSVVLVAATDLLPKEVEMVRWTGAEFGPCLAPCLEVSLLATQPGTIRAQLITRNGCEAVDQLELEVASQSSVFLPTAFSPDGDGINDLLIVFAHPGIAQVTSLKIFDRWGNLLHQRSNFPPNEEAYGWDGTVQGRALAPGVYLYLVEFEGLDSRQDRLVGSIVLL